MTYESAVAELGRAYKIIDGLQAQIARISSENADLIQRNRRLEELYESAKEVTRRYQSSDRVKAAVHCDCLEELRQHNKHISEMVAEFCIAAGVVKDEQTSD